MEKIYLRDVLGLVWAARFFMMCSVAACLLIAFVLLIVTPPQYEARVTLVPTRANQYAQSGGSGQSLAGSFAGQLLGMGGDKNAQSTEQFMELMTSPFVVGLIDQRYHIVPHIFSGQWNAAEKHWVKPSGPIVAIKGVIKSLLNLPAWAPPGPYDASVELTARTVVDVSQQTGMVHVSIRDKDPAYAVFLLKALYETTDNLLREKAKQRSDEHIVYIQRQLTSVNYTENRQSLTSLLTAELSQQLLINSNAPFVLEKLSPISQPPRPVSPKISTYILIAVFLGVVFGFVLSLMDKKYVLGDIIRVQWKRLSERGGAALH